MEPRRNRAWNHRAVDHVDGARGEQPCVPSGEFIPGAAFAPRTVDVIRDHANATDVLMTNS